jgi:hypothetical protein
LGSALDLAKHRYDSDLKGCGFKPHRKQQSWPRL